MPLHVPKYRRPFSRTWENKVSRQLFEFIATAGIPSREFPLFAKVPGYVSWSGYFRSQEIIAKGLIARTHEFAISKIAFQSNAIKIIVHAAFDLEIDVRFILTRGRRNNIENYRERKHNEHGKRARCTSSIFPLQISFLYSIICEIYV